MKMIVVIIVAPIFICFFPLLQFLKLELKNLISSVSGAPSESCIGKNPKKHLLIIRQRVYRGTNKPNVR